MNNQEPEWLALVREKVESLRFGVVQIVIHDSKVTLIERTEKTRLGPPEHKFYSDRPDTLEATKPTGAFDRTTGGRSR
jgi:hypothetical protein